MLYDACVVLFLGFVHPFKGQEKCLWHYSCFSATISDGSGQSGYFENGRQSDDQNGE